MVRTYTVDHTSPPAVQLSAQPVEFGVALSWTESNVTDLAYYRLYRSTTPGGGYQPINGAITQTSFLDTNVTVGTTYYYVAAALDQVGNPSNYSNESAAAPHDDSTPPQIGSLLPADGSRSARRRASSSDGHRQCRRG